MTPPQNRVFFASELEGVATFWRIHRPDGVTLGFTSHDRDLYFGGVRHRAAPGVLPSAVRRTAGLTGDSAEMQGALAHDSIAETDLATGRFDGARVEVGAVDWETREHAVLYNGTVGGVAREDGGFTAELRSAKAALEADTVPRTSPTCRARFCGPGCGLSAAKYTHRAALVAAHPDTGRVELDGPAPELLAHGTLRWLGGPCAGLRAEIVAADGTGVILDAVSEGLVPGAHVIAREGCDHTLATCAARFGNAVNFRGEPFLPGNDLLARYPSPA